MSGKAFVADVSGAMYWPAEETLVVSDLHFEKEAALGERVSLLPPYDTRATLSRLGDVIEHYQPQRLLALGDSVHGANAADTMSREDLDKLRSLQDGMEWLWITGNGDADIPDSLGGEVRSQVSIGGLTFRHEPVHAPVSHEIAGHLHPVAKLMKQGRVEQHRCFISTGTRLVMPAFGANSSGFNVLGDVFTPLFSGESLFVWMVGWNEVYPVAARQLLED